jgi:hypothetical protein
MLDASDHAESMAGTTVQLERVICELSLIKMRGSGTDKIVVRNNKSREKSHV